METYSNILSCHGCCTELSQGNTSPSSGFVVVVVGVGSSWLSAINYVNSILIHLSNNQPIDIYFLVLNLDIKTTGGNPDLTEKFNGNGDSTNRRNPA